jgi:catalase
MKHTLKLAVSVVALTLASAAFTPVIAGPQKESPLTTVQALQAAFGDHHAGHARAVHTNGVIFEGTFTPAPEARSIVKTPIFTGGPLPIIARFSTFAGVPDLPDNHDGAAPAGIGIKIKSVDGVGKDFDVQGNNHPDFIVANVDDFVVFFKALGATKDDSPHPNPVEQFLATHPHAKDFLASRRYPASWAQAKFFGINSVKLTNAEGKSVFARYQFVPRDGEQYLSPEERKAKSATYLHDGIAQRAAEGPIVFDWYAQIADKGDAIEDPSIAWPETRRRVKLGTFSLDHQPKDADAVGKSLVFLIGQSQPGVEPADPMLVLRNTADVISFGERQ